MKKLTQLKTLMLLVIISIFVNPVFATSKSDLAKEKRWAEQVIPGIIVGENITLKADGVKFLALFARATTSKQRGAVILIHGKGAHPAWPDVIEPLRINLPDKGWDTLSLQMPILENKANDTDYPQLMKEVPGRIQAGVEFLKSKGIKNIVISGHSMGAVMASYYLATHPDPSVNTFAILSCGPGIPGDPSMDFMKNFQHINNIQILDVYGENDLEMVREAIRKRQFDAVNSTGKDYQVMTLPNAGHFYRDSQSVLTNALAGWLNKHSRK